MTAGQQEASRLRAAEVLLDRGWGKAVQTHAMQVWQGKGDFLTLLKSDPAVRAKLKPAEIEKNFDLGYHFKHVDTIFKRVFGKA